VSDLHHPQLIQEYYPEAIQIYKQLNSLEKVNGLEPDQGWQHKNKEATNTTGAFQDWVSIRRLERKLKTLQQELENAHAQIASLENAGQISA